MFIVHDKRNDIMPKTLFQHDHSTNATIIVIERMDLFKASVEIQNGIEINRFIFISLNQLFQFTADLFCRDTQD